MSVNGKLILAVKMLLEREQYKADLNQAVADTQGAASRIEGSTRGVAEAVQDVVGGESAAVNAASRAITVMGPAAAAAVAAAIAVGAAYNQAHQETLGYEKAIILTGNAAGVTSGQLADMARSIDGVVGTQANAAAALASMTETGQVARENLQKVSLAAVETERATGQSISETAKIFASLGDAPVKASLRLNESMNYLTAGTYAQIKAAEDLGDKETAASIAQNAAADALRERAARVEQHLGTLERAWRGVRDFAKEAWDAMLNVGRDQTSGEKLETVRKRIADLENKIAASRDFAETAGGAATGRPNGTARMQAELQALQVEAAALAGVANQASEAANAERERAAAVKASIALAEEAGRHDSELEKTRKAVAQATQQYTTAIKNEGLTQQERAQIESSYLKVVSDLTKVKEKSAGARKAALTEEEREAATIANLAGLTSDYQQKLTELQRARDKGNISEERYIELVEALIAKQPMAKKLMDDQAKATAAAEKATLELAKARDKDLASTQAATEKVRAAVVAQLEQNARLGLTKEAIADLDAAKLEMMATDLELQAIAQMDKNLDEQRYELLKEQAQAYRDLAKAKREGAAKQAGIDAMAELTREAEHAAAEGKRAAERVEQSLTDALMRGFEAGKGFGENMADAIENMFKTMVLRPVISFVVSPIAGLISSTITGALSSMGLGGSSILGSAGSLFSAGSNVLGNLGSWLGLGGGAATGIGLAATTGTGLSLAGAGTGLGLSAGAGTGLGLASAGGGLGITGASAGASSIGAGLGAGAGAGGGIAGALSAVPVWGWALAAGALLGLLGGGGETRVGGQFGVAYDGKVENNRRGETYTYQGQQYDRDFSGGRRDALVDGEAYRLEGDPLENEKAIRDAVAGTAAGINGMLKALGSKATLTGFSAGLETSSKDRGGVFAGGTLSNGASFGESGKGDNYAGTLYEKFSTNSPDFKTALAEFSLDLKQSAVQALQVVDDIPESIKKRVAGVDVEALSSEAVDALLVSINEEIAGVESFRTALSALGLDQFADMAFDAASAIAEASGGWDQLQANLSTYYENYLTESERTALKTRQVKDALAEVGLEMPKTREEFKAMLETALAMGEDGAKVVAVLLGVGGAFADITPKIVTLADAFAVTGDTIKGILDDAIANAGSAAEANQMAAEAFVNGIYSSINDALTSSLSGLIMGAIQPMVDSLIAGATTSASAMATGGAAGGSAVATGGAAGGSAVATGGATAGAAMAGVIEQAKAQISAFATILNDPDIQAAIREIGGIVGGVAGAAYGAVPAYRPAAVSSGGGGGGGGGASKSINDLSDALERLGDTAAEEVKRLRGITTEESDRGQALLLAQFASATAAARAGDKTAFASLTDLSRDIERVTAATAVTNIENVRMRAWLAASLEQTMSALGLDLPAFDVGTNFVPADMVAMVHKGERIIPAADNSALMAALDAPSGGGNGDVVAELRAVQAQLAVLVAAMQRTAMNTDGLPQLVDQFDFLTQGGNEARVEVVNRVDVKVVA